MNMMEHAMKKAGIQLPTLAERVWNYVKDHPKVSSPSVAAAMGVPNATVSSVLSKMEIRRMLRGENVEMRGKIGVGFGVRQVRHYSVAIPEYELLPMPKDYVSKRGAKAKAVKEKRAPEQLATNSELKVVSIPSASKVQEVPKVVTVKERVENMTVKEARELYMELREAFKTGW